MSLPYVLGAVPEGIVDGTNWEFRAHTQYASGSLEVFLNGQAKRKDYADGWVELRNGYFRLKQVPAVGDVVQVSYRPL